MFLRVSTSFSMPEKFFPPNLIRVKRKKKLSDGMDLLSFDSIISPWDHRLRPEIDSSSDRKLQTQFERSTKTDEEQNSKVNFQDRNDQVKLKTSVKFSLSSNVPEFSIRPLFPFTFDLAPQPVNNKDQEQQQQQQQRFETVTTLTPVEKTNEWLKNLCQKRRQKRYR